MFVGTSVAGGVLGRVGAGVCEATGCGGSGCGADNASVLRGEEKKRSGETDIRQGETSDCTGWL